MRTHRSLRQAGFTLIELMVVLAVIAVLLFVAAPSFREMMDVQRVRGVSDQFITDVQFARSEAASRQEKIGITFKPPGAGFTCYVVHTCGSLAADSCRCDCTAAPGSRCPVPNVGLPDPPREIKTVQLRDGAGVRLEPVLLNGNPVGGAATSSHVTFDPTTGGLSTYYASGLLLLPRPPGGALWVKTSSTLSNNAVAIRDIVNTVGRPSSCRPVGSSISGLMPC